MVPINGERAYVLLLPSSILLSSLTLFHNRCLVVFLLLNKWKKIEVVSCDYIG